MAEGLTIILLMKKQDERVPVTRPKLYTKLIKANRVKGSVLRIKWKTVWHYYQV